MQRYTHLYETHPRPADLSPAERRLKVRILLETYANMRERAKLEYQRTVITDVAVDQMDELYGSWFQQSYPEYVAEGERQARLDEHKILAALDEEGRKKRYLELSNE